MRYVPHTATCPPVGTVSGIVNHYADEAAQELALMATLQMVMPKCLLPASLDVEGLDGLEARIKAGANVVTSIVPPRMRLGRSGLPNPGHRQLPARSTSRTGRAFIRLKMRPASNETYTRWLMGDNLPTRATNGQGLCA